MPDWQPALGRRLAPLRLRPAREREIIDELSQHLDDRCQELLAGGVTEEEAVRLALDELDDEQLLASEMHRLRRSSLPEPLPPGLPARSWLADARDDLAYAARMLRKNPGFSAAAILTLALGIGANSAIFSLVNATLLHRLPIQNGERLLHVFRNTGAWHSVSYPAYVAVRDGARLVEGLAAWGPITASLNAGGETSLVSGAIVSGNFFDLLGMSAERGRLLSATDDATPMAHPVAVISDRLWRSRLAARPDIVGSQIRLNGTIFTVVGVAPPGFTSPRRGTVYDIYVPMMMQPLIRPPSAGYSGEMDPDLLKKPNNAWLLLFALRRRDVTPEQVRAEIMAVAATRAPVPNARLREMPLTLVPFEMGSPAQYAQLRTVATLLGCTVGIVLLIACANVANLLLSKAAARRREVAIRLALGASRWRIVRQLLTESVLLSTLGGAAGLVLASLVMVAWRAAPPPAGALPVALEFSIDRRVILFSFVLAGMTGILFGALPALQASRPGLLPALKDDGFAHDGRSGRFNLKKVLVVAEVALSLLLLIAAGLFIRSLRSVQAVMPGYAVDELVSMPLNINLLRYTTAQGRAFYSRVVERVERIPGVKTASVARMPVLTGVARSIGLTIEGRDGSEGALANVVGPRFFETVGIPLVRGRDFGSGDTTESPLVAIVSETLATRFFPGDDPIGRRLTAGFSRTGNPRGDWVEIVGVVRDTKYTAIQESATPVIYVPLAQRHETGVTLYVRGRESPGALIPHLRREIQAIEPDLPIHDVRTMAETVESSLYAPRMGALLLTGFAALALLLASLGVYGVLAFSIARRTREIGIRIALGADRRAVSALVLREGMSLVAVGLAIGLGGGLYLSKWVRSLLFDVSPHDVTTFAVVPVVLASVALLACYLPARRALRVDPLLALRAE